MRSLNHNPEGLRARPRPTSPGTCGQIPWVPGIYQIVCVPTGEVYVGHSTCLGKRWLFHQKRLFDGSHGNPKLLRAFRRYGPSQFYFQILEYGPRSVHALQVREQHYIDKAEKKFNIAPASGRRPSSHRPMWRLYRDRQGGVS